MAELYARSGIDVNEVKYVEAHGTGTQVGLFFLCCLSLCTSVLLSNYK